MGKQKSNVTVTIEILASVAVVLMCLSSAVDLLAFSSPLNSPLPTEDPDPLSGCPGQCVIIIEGYGPACAQWCLDTWGLEVPDYKQEDWILNNILKPTPVPTPAAEWYVGLWLGKYPMYTDGTRITRIEGWE